MNGLAICAGVGGLELGLTLAIPGYRTVGYVEREAFAAATLVGRMEEKALGPAPIWDDIESFPGSLYRGRVDLISAGFPCQPFSAAGKQLGLEDERWLWPLVERVIRDVQPRWVVLENVPGLVLHGLGSVIGGLASLGYDAEWDLHSAQSVGAPHKRERFFLLARRVSDTVSDPLRDESERGSGPAPTADGRDAESRDVVEGLADAEGHDERRDSQPRSDGQGESAGGRGWDLADTHGLQQSPDGGRPLSQPDRRRHAPRRGEGVADTEGGGARSGQQPGQLRGSLEGLPIVADPSRDRLERLERAGTASGATGRSGLPLFPPGPTDLGMWARVLAETPEVEPAVCRVAHELAYRVDRLRACGNGVHPLAAAVAVLSLAARAGWLEELVVTAEAMHLAVAP